VAVRRHEPMSSATGNATIKAGTNRSAGHRWLTAPRPAAGRGSDAVEWGVVPGSAPVPPARQDYPRPDSPAGVSGGRDGPARDIAAPFRARAIGIALIQGAHGETTTPTISKRRGQRARCYPGRRALLGERSVRRRDRQLRGDRGADNPAVFGGRALAACCTALAQDRTPRR
jgi:hypothetical protein